MVQPAWYVGSTTPRECAPKSSADLNMNVWCVVVSPPALSASGLVAQDSQEARAAERNLTAEAVTEVKGPSLIKVAVLEAWLLDYPRQEDANYLLAGFKEGFRIPAVGEQKAFSAKNLKSVHGMERVVQEKIDKEVREGRVLGPFSTPPLDTLWVSSLGIIPKKAPGKFRLI